MATTETTEDAAAFGPEICAPAGERIEPEQHPSSMVLERVLHDLQVQGINVGMQSFAWCGVRVWIGDPMNGMAATGYLPDSGPWADGIVAGWLHRKVIELYPECEYARRHTGGLANETE